MSRRPPPSGLLHAYAPPRVATGLVSQAREVVLERRDEAPHEVVPAAQVRRRHDVLARRALVPAQPAHRSELGEGAAADEEDLGRVRVRVTVRDRVRVRVTVTVQVRAEGQGSCSTIR